MSGGSWDYATFNVARLVERMAHDSRPGLRAIAARLVDLADVLHDVEWVDSADYGAGDEDAAIARCLERMTGAPASLAIAETLLRDARSQVEAAEAQLAAARVVTP